MVILIENIADMNGIPPEEQLQLDKLLDGMLKEVENFPDYRTPNTKTTSDTNANLSASFPATKPPSQVTFSFSKNGSQQLSEINSNPSVSSNLTDSVLSPRPTSPASTVTSNNERVGSPIPLITDHFGKMEPLPLRLLTKPEPIVTNEKNMSYHARHGSQPFSYGVTEGSPALMRRRIHSESTAYICESSPPSSATLDSNVEGLYSKPISWLQRQQLKLKTRQEGKDMRTKEMVMAELKGSIIKQDYDDGVHTPSDGSVMSGGQVSAINAARTSSPTDHYSKPYDGLSDISVLSGNLYAVTAKPVTSTRNLKFNGHLAHNVMNGGQTSPVSPIRTVSPGFYSKMYGGQSDASVVDGPLTTAVTSARPPSPALRTSSPAPRTSSPLPRPSSARRNPMLFNGQSESSVASGQGSNASGPRGSSPGRFSKLYDGSLRSSLASLSESEVISSHPSFIKDTSKYWYKKNITRDEAINLLADKPPGTFVIRDSKSFPGSFGLAFKVSSPPPNVPKTKAAGDTELIRHYLIEPTSKGVRIKGCPEEPVFSSLPALVYQHSITPLGLPCKLLIPDSDLTMSNSASDRMFQRQELLEQGAACNVLYFISVETESLTGPQAIRNAITDLLSQKPPPTGTVVHFKVSSSGITLTDNSHKLFFRRHYPLHSVSHFGMDPDNRFFTAQQKSGKLGSCMLFGFVASKKVNSLENECHIFAEYVMEQPASAIVTFANKVILASAASSSPSSPYSTSSSPSPRRRI